MKLKKKIPFEFVLELLDELNPRIKPMFGCYAIYIEEKLVLILREKSDFLNDNGIWIATTPEHHDSLRKDFPMMKSLELFKSKKPTTWQNLPSNHPDFESNARLVCKFIHYNDPRVGKVPKRKKKLKIQKSKDPPKIKKSYKKLQKVTK